MRFLLILFGLIISGTGHLMAQDDMAGEVARLIKEGNATELSRHFMGNVDLTILQTDDVYSRAQATQITKKFFDEHQPTGFSVKHQGKSKLDDHYRIGTLTTNNGDFRVTYFLKNNDGKFQIKQLRIESNDRGF